MYYTAHACYGENKKVFNNCYLQNCNLSKHVQIKICCRPVAEIVSANLTTHSAKKQKAPHYANQYERYESKNRFVNPFETDSNIFIDIKFSKIYMTDRRPLEIF